MREHYCKASRLSHRGSRRCRRTVSQEVGRWSRCWHKQGERACTREPRSFLHPSYPRNRCPGHTPRPCWYSELKYTQKIRPKIQNSLAKMLQLINFKWIKKVFIPEEEKQSYFIGQNWVYARCVINIFDLCLGRLYILHFRIKLA